MQRYLLDKLNKKFPSEKRQHLLARLRHPAWPGTLRRTSPLSDHWGVERGTPIDRYYIENFLDQHQEDIRGHVLEMKDSVYTDRFGSAVIQKDVLDIDPANPQVTVLADLAKADAVPSGSFDCFIFTQTLQFIYDLSAGIKHIWRILRPGGVLLATLPGISRVEGAYADIDFWRFTPASARALFQEIFGAENITLQTYGNVLSGIAFLTGMATEELSPKELEVQDQFFPVVIGIRAIKPE